VRDNNTGLVWEKSPSGISTCCFQWTTARRHCADKVVGNQKGWRLPSFAELASLVDPTVPFPGPMLQPGHPFLNVQPSFYWSASTDAEVPETAWAVFFSNGAVGTHNKGNPFYVWCVRGGMEESVY
jgi:hypothetical protein